MKASMTSASNDFYSGVLAALGVVYLQDAETLAEEIVGTVGAKELLRVAKRNEDPWLPNLKATIRFLKDRDRLSDWVIAAWVRREMEAMP